MQDVRICFDALLTQYPSLNSHIAVDSQKVSNPAFENGLVALQKGTIGTLDERTKLAIKRFEGEEVAIVLNEDLEQSLVLKALHNSRMISQGGYVDTFRVCPTSNHLERLFSQCKLIRSQLRQRMYPGTLETKHVLCIWHINKNIVANCKKHFTIDDTWNFFMSDWNMLLTYATDEIFCFKMGNIQGKI
jgi:hypothetical protein